MKRLPSFNMMSWVFESLEDFGPNAPARVASCVPPIFPSYVKILHPIYEDRSIPGWSLSWQDAIEADPPS